MKKGFGKINFLILALVSFMALGCQNGVVDYKGAGYTDQQITLGTPHLNGKTYPGVNYIYWDRVANAVNGYTLSIYEDGVLKNETPITLGENQTYYIDTDLKYNVSKTYKLRAIGDSKGRYVIYTESDSDSITLNPILPPTDTPALELAKYEKGYKEGEEYKLSEADSEFMLSEDTIKVAKNEAQGTFTVTFPVKAYLKYTVYADYGNTFDVTGIHEYTVTTTPYQDMAVNNKNVTVKGIATVSGDYKIYVKASAYNSNYFNNSGDIKASTGLSYNSLALTSTYTANNISYTYDNEKSVTISWEPAVLADGTYAKPGQYKIYKTPWGLTNYEAVTANIRLINPTDSETPIYRITDTTDGESYKYIFVLTDGKSYASICSKTKVAYALTDTTESSISIVWKDVDDDGAYNDAYVLVTLADEDKYLSKVTYGVADTADAAYEIAFTGTNPLKVEGVYKVYAFTLKDIATESGKILSVYATISENGKKDNYISKDSTYNKPDADTFSLYDDVINIEEADDDDLYNDVSFAVVASKPETSIKVTYAFADDSDTAVKLLDSAEAKTLVTGLTGYTYYEFSPANTKYAALKNFALDKYIAIRITASQNNNADRIADYVSSITTYDATNKTAASTSTYAAFKALDDDRIANDLYATIEVYKDQKISKLYYSTATSDEYTADENVLVNRLNSSNVVDITKDIKEKYHTDEKIIYEVTVKDFEIGDYVALGYVLSETGYLDYSGSIAVGPVTDNVVAVETTAAPVLSQSAIYFDAFDSDANYNDIKSDTISISIDVNQSISAIRYAYAETKDKLDELLRTESTAAKDLSIPDSYELKTGVSEAAATLTKIYNFTPYIRNVPDGNMAGIKIIISEPGYEDYATTLYTAATSYSFTPTSGTTETISVNNYAEQKPVQKAVLFVDDGQNWEYVHVTLGDYFYKDSVNNYFYKLERTFEDTYNKDDTIWETIEESITLSRDYSYGSYYYDFANYYKDIPVGNYVYRLTKTRKASASVTKEEETVVTDAGVTVVYNLTIGTFEFSYYNCDSDSAYLGLTLKENIGPIVDDIDKYNYEFSYYVTYGTTSYSYLEKTETQKLTGWAWEKELDTYGKETGYWFTSMAIPNIYNSSYPYVTVYVTARKERGTGGTIYNTETVTFSFDWTATIDSSSTLTISTPYAYKYSNSSSNGTTYLHIEEPTGSYNYYEWYLNGNLINGEHAKSIELDTSNLNSYSSNEIKVKVYDDTYTLTGTAIVSYYKNSY